MQNNILHMTDIGRNNNLIIIEKYRKQQNLIIIYNPLWPIILVTHL